MDLFKNPLVLIGIIILAIFLATNDKIPSSQSLTGIVMSNPRIITPSIQDGQNLKAQVTVKYPDGYDGYIVEANVRPSGTQAAVQNTIGPSSNCDYLLGTVNERYYPTKWYENNYDWVGISTLVTYTFTWDNGLHSTAGLPFGQNDVRFTIYHVPLLSNLGFEAACRAVRNGGDVNTNIQDDYVGSFILQAGQCDPPGFVEYKTINECENSRTCKPDYTWGPYTKLDPSCDGECDEGDTQTVSGCSQTCINYKWVNDDVDCKGEPVVPPKDEDKDDDFLKKYGLWIVLGFAAVLLITVLGGKNR